MSHAETPRSQVSEGETGSKGDWKGRLWIAECGMRNGETKQALPFPWCMATRALMVARGARHGQPGPLYVRIRCWVQWGPGVSTLLALGTRLCCACALVLALTPRSPLHGTPRSRPALPPGWPSPRGRPGLGSSGGLGNSSISGMREGTRPGRGAAEKGTGHLLGGKCLNSWMGDFNSWRSRIRNPGRNPRRCHV